MALVAWSSAGSSDRPTVLTSTFLTGGQEASAAWALARSDVVDYNIIGNRVSEVTPNLSHVHKRSLGVLEVTPTLDHEALWVTLESREWLFMSSLMQLPRELPY